MKLSCVDDGGIRPAWDVVCRWADGRLRFRHRVFATSEEDAWRQADALAPDADDSAWSLPTPTAARHAGTGTGDDPGEVGR